MKQFKYEGDLVSQYLSGLVAANPQLALLDQHVVVSKESLKSKKVKLISGGGSGHEPTHAGLIGDGLLDAVAVGQVFASPGSVQVQRALAAVNGEEGTLVIVKNYTGDVLHFGLAAEKAQATGEKVKVVTVGDDVSVGRKQGAIVGRRGLAGVVLVHKIAGSAAKKGLSLEDVASVAESTASNLATIAASLDHCVVPGRKFNSELSQSQYEIGMGIHNEPGAFREDGIPEITDLVEKLLPFILDQKDEDRAFVKFDDKDEVVLLVNNLGGLSNFETSLITKVVLDSLSKKYSIKPIRVISGTFTTAFNGPGFSITLLNVSKAGDKVLEYLDAPTNAPGWVARGTTEEWKHAKEVPKLPEFEHNKPVTSDVKTNSQFVENLKKGLNNVIKEEPKITEYDTVAGDGDCGETLKAGATGVLEALDSGDIKSGDAVAALVRIADIVDEKMGGTSGGLYSIFLTAFAGQLREAAPKELNREAASAAAKGALETLFKYTKARKGDKTLVDALQPFVENLDKGTSEAIQAAQKGVDDTTKLHAKAGRAAYVGDSGDPVPDPGAYGLVFLLKGLCGE